MGTTTYFAFTASEMPFHKLSHEAMHILDFLIRQAESGGKYANNSLKAEDAALVIIQEFKKRYGVKFTEGQVKKAIIELKQTGFLEYSKDKDGEKCLFINCDYYVRVDRNYSK